MEVGFTAPSEREERVNEGINAYVAGPKAGRQLDPDDWFRRHSDLDPESACFVDDKCHFESLVNSFRAPPPRTPSASTTPTIPVTSDFLQRQANTPVPSSRLGDCELVEKPPLKQRRNLRATEK
jgi:hypothetical protein